MFGHRHVSGYRHRVARGQLVGYVHVVGMLRLEMLARRLPFPRLGGFLSPAQLFPRLVVVGRGQAARELREVGAQRPSVARALFEHVGHARVRLVAGTHDLDGGQAALAVALHNDYVVARHAAHDVRALHFAAHGLHTRHLARRGNDRLAGAGSAVAVGVLAGVVDVEADMAVVLDAAHVMAACHQFGDQLLDERRLPRIVPADDGDCWAGYVNHCFHFHLRFPAAPVAWRPDANALVLLAAQYSTTRHAPTEVSGKRATRPFRAWASTAQRYNGAKEEACAKRKTG